MEKISNLLHMTTKTFCTMVRLRCHDYGFECGFISEGEIEKVLEEFRNHTEDEHGIDYSKEVLMQFILRKSG